jgi:hypothetical protein
MHLIFYLNPHHRFHVIQPVDFNLLCLFSSPPTRKWQPNRSILHLSSPLYSAKCQRPSCIRSFLFKSTSPVPCHPTRRLQSTLPLLPPPPTRKQQPNRPILRLSSPLYSAKSMPLCLPTNDDLPPHLMDSTPPALPSYIK